GDRAEHDGSGPPPAGAGDIVADRAARACGYGSAPAAGRLTDVASAPRVSGDETGRFAKPVVADASCPRMQPTAYPQPRPWQYPMPARVSIFADRPSCASRSCRMDRSAANGTSSQRQTVVSSDSRSTQPDGTGWDRCIARAKRRSLARERRSRDGADGPPAATAPAISPSTTASAAPPTPQASPATKTPSTDERCPSSTSHTSDPSTSTRVAQPSASGNS